MTNKIISMYISDIEKSSTKFKKTHKVKVSGPYDDEEMPKWFKKWVETDYGPFKKLVIDQFKKHRWIKK
ncbi:MAG: hypothetical protein ACOQNY_01245 [Mycoplasmoidaceae bacterium]